MSKTDVTDDSSNAAVAPPKLSNKEVVSLLTDPANIQILRDGFQRMDRADDGFLDFDDLKQFAVDPHNSEKERKVAASAMAGFDAISRVVNDGISVKGQSITSADLTRLQGIDSDRGWHFHPELNGDAILFRTIEMGALGMAGGTFAGAITGGPFGAVGGMAMGLVCGAAAGALTETVDQVGDQWSMADFDKRQRDENMNRFLGDLQRDLKNTHNRLSLVGDVDENFELPVGAYTFDGAEFKETYLTQPDGRQDLVLDCAEFRVRVNDKFNAGSTLVQFKTDYAGFPAGTVVRIDRKMPDRGIFSDPTNFVGTEYVRYPDGREETKEYARSMRFTPLENLMLYRKGAFKTWD